MEAGASEIALVDIPDGKEFSWMVGDKIVIASTDYFGRHAEERTIIAVSGEHPSFVLTLDEVLEYKHYAGVETYPEEKEEEEGEEENKQILEMRAEVGLLSRNIVVRGDAETSAANQYGAHIMLHPGVENSVLGRIENVELTDVGQAHKLGRYPIHFHMAGNVHGSYIKGCAIHQAFNRGITIHGVQALTVQDNVLYHVLGHTIFLEDGAETGNVIERNLVVDTRASWSLLVTD